MPQLTVRSRVAMVLIALSSATAICAAPPEACSLLSMERIDSITGRKLAMSPDRPTNDASGMTATGCSYSGNDEFGAVIKVETFNSVESLQSFLRIRREGMSRIGIDEVGDSVGGTPASFFLNKRGAGQMSVVEGTLILEAGVHSRTVNDSGTFSRDMSRKLLAAVMAELALIHPGKSSQRSVPRDAAEEARPAPGYQEGGNHPVGLIDSLLLLLGATPGMSGPVRVSTLPAQVLQSRGSDSQILNFDLIADNASNRKLTLSGLEMTIFAQDGGLILQRRLTENGGSIETIPDRELPPSGRLVIFNPFQSLPADLTISKVHYELSFDCEGKAPVITAIDFWPRVFEPKTDLIIPVLGRMFVYDGNDYYGHHRRLDITGAMTTAMGIQTNFIRYAYDFCIVDSEGKMFAGTGARNEDWYGFGTPILAPGGGLVVASENSVPDNTASTRATEITPDAVKKNPRLPFGNYVLIDHGNGEYSFLAHMKQGSVTVKGGQIVRQGQQIGQMGFSGDALMVHLHYQLQSDATFGEGLPAFFRDFKVYVGGKSVRSSGRQQLDSGEVVESNARPRN